MRTTIFDTKEQIRVQAGEVVTFIYPYIYKWIKVPATEGGWIAIREIMRHAFNHELEPHGLEFHVGTKFILDAEPEDLTDELNALIIERFDELRLNFGEDARIRIVALSK